MIGDITLVISGDLVLGLLVGAALMLVAIGCVSHAGKGEDDAST